jgi:hypothetical protein
LISGNALNQFKQTVEFLVKGTQECSDHNNIVALFAECIWDDWSRTVCDRILTPLFVSTSASAITSVQSSCMETMQQFSNDLAAVYGDVFDCTAIKKATQDVSSIRFQHLRSHWLFEIRDMLLKDDYTTVPMVDLALQGTLHEYIEINYSRASKSAWQIRNRPQGY